MKNNKKIDQYLEKWQLKINGLPIETDKGFVAFVESEGRPALLKIFNSVDECKSMALTLKHYDGEGAEKILNSAKDALLLEGLEPGHSLTKMVLDGNDEQAIHIACDIIKKLHSKKSSNKNLPDLEKFLKDFEWYKSSNNMEIEDEILKLAMEIFAQLLKSTGKKILLHGNLHQDHILSDARRGWLAINPEGIFGDPVYEAAALLINPVKYPIFYIPKEIIDKRMEIISKKLGFTKERILCWTFIKAVLSVIWAMQNNADYKNYLLMAKMLFSVIVINSKMAEVIN